MWNYDAVKWNFISPSTRLPPLERNSQTRREHNLKLKRFLPQSSDSILNFCVHFTTRTKLCFYYKLTSMIYINDSPCFNIMLCSLSFHSGVLRALRKLNSCGCVSEGWFMKGSRSPQTDINASLWSRIQFAETSINVGRSESQKYDSLKILSTFDVFFSALFRL